jgi:transcription elongation factor Elf1
MHWLEQKYIGLVSNRLRNYKRKSPTLYNFSCPFCLDSESDKRKARGYMYDKKGTTLFHCHNCGKTTSFNKFIEELDVQLYTEFSLEKLKDSNQLKSIKQEKDQDLHDFVQRMKKPVFLKEGPLKGLKKVSQLKPDHPIKVYVESRMIPNPYHAKMFYCPNFFAWCNEIIPGKFSKESLTRDEERLLIPFINKEQIMHAFQGRSLDSNNKFRYITLVNDESVPKVYGLDTVDFNKKTYVLEGPIDSTFLPNAIATAGGDLVSTVKDFPKKNLVVVYDNEPRSKEARKKLEKAIINGYSVCIWPESLEYKDINDAILAGLTSEFIQYIIDTHTYRDLRARLELSKWSKV